MATATRSGFVSFATLVIFLAALGLAALHQHSDHSDEHECPACLWTQAAGGLQISEAPVIKTLEPMACLSAETHEGVLPREVPGITRPRSPPTILS
jgi:hypothetical protein